MTTDNGSQFTSARYVETLNQLGISHRRTAYNHPEGNSYIERFHRSLKVASPPTVGGGRVGDLLAVTV